MPVLGKEHRLLAPMQMRFVEEYIKDPTSQSKAAKRAGYSISTAPEAASRLMADPRVQRLLEEATQRAIRALGITKERVLQELAIVAFSNPNAVITLDENGEPTIDLAGLSRSKDGAGEVSISSMTGRGGTTKIVQVKSVKPADKVAALEKLGKAMNMFTDKVEITNKLSLQDLIEQSYGDVEVLEQPEFAMIESHPISEEEATEAVTERSESL